MPWQKFREKILLVQSSVKIGRIGPQYSDICKIYHVWKF